jgi:diguanylate cyclase (GGDEF)-like protein
VDAGISRAVLTAIIETQTAIAAATEVSDVMAVVTARTRQLTRADGAVVELAEGAHMVYRAASGTAAPFLGTKLDIALSLSGRCVRSGEVLRCEDSERDDRVDRAACARIGVRSMIVVPLTDAKRVVGVLKVMSGRPGAFTAQDEQVLVVMAGFIGAAMSRAAAFELAAHRATHDELTKLPNRFLARDRLRQSLAQIGRGIAGVAVLFLDLDGFKRANDRYGHQVGDEVLVIAARRIERALRAGDTVARLGGDEFAIVAPGIDSADAVQVITDRVRSVFAAAFDTSAGPVTIGASIGTALTTSSVASVDDLLACADHAMYEDKAARKRPTAA